MLPNGFNSLNTNCLYQADIGMICPISYSDSLVTIQPYFLCDTHIQEQVVQELSKEWPEYTHEYVQKNLCCGDYLFVATNIFGFIGTISVDRKGFLPYIGTLFVTPRLRKFGHSKTLMHFGETFIKEILKFTESRLWCDECMIDYYLPLGYIFQSKEQDKCILKKLI